MGQGLQNTGTTVLDFYAFAFQVLADLPEIVLLERTVLFHTVGLRIFQGKYIIQFIDVSPRDVGLPCSRPRKYMPLTLNFKISLRLFFDRCLSGSSLFAPIAPPARSCTLSLIQSFVKKVLSIHYAKQERIHETSQRQALDVEAGACSGSLREFARIQKIGG